MTAEVYSIINLVIYVLVGVMVAIGMLFGFIRGFKRQTIRFATVIFSIAVSYTVCKLLTPTILSYLNELDLGAMLGSDASNILTHIDKETISCVLALPAALIIAPLLTIPIFFVLHIITEIVHKILCGIFGFTRDNNNVVTRFIGLGIGAVSGLLISMVILVPICGIISTAGGAIAETKEKYPECENTVVLSGMYDDYLSPVATNPVVVATDTVFGFGYDIMSGVELEGEGVDLQKSVGSALCIFVKIGDLSSTDFVNLTPEDKAVFDAVIDEVEEDRYVAMLMSGVLRSAKGILGEGMLEGIEEPMKSFIDSIFGVLATSDKDNLSGDLETLVDVYYLLSSSGAMSALGGGGGGDVLDALMATDAEGATVIARMNAILSANERMSAIVAEFVNMSMSMLLQNSGVDSSVVETVDNVKDGLNTALAIKEEDYSSPEEYKAAVSDQLNTTLEENGIGLDDEQLSAVTDFVINEMSDVEEITDADIADFICKYYDVYMNSGASEPELP